MRNFSAEINSRTMYAVPSHMAIELLPKMEAILLTLMETSSPTKVTTSEERCISELREWAVAVQDTDSVCNPAANGSFIYINMNTGRMALFIVSYGYGDYGITGRLF